LLSVVVCGQKDFTGPIKKALESVGLSVSGEAVSVQDLYMLIDSSGATAAVAPTSEEWVAGVLSLVDMRRNVHFFVCGPLRRGMWSDLGAKGVYSLINDPKQVAVTVASVLDKDSPTTRTSAERPVVVSVQESQVDLLSRVVAVFYSAKGGVGKTTTTSNVAAVVGMWTRQLADRTGKNFRVCVIDINFEGKGAIRNYFGFPLLDKEHRKAKSIVSFSQLGPTAGFEAVRSVLNYHDKSNVYFVSPPQTVQEKVEYQDDHFKLCIDLVRKYFDFVFIDMGVRLDTNNAVIACDRATDILVVSDLDPSTIGALNDARSEMQQIFGGWSRTRLVVNDSGRGGSSERDVVQTLQLPPTVFLPHSSASLAAKEKCMPLVCLAPHDKYSRAAEKLAQKVLGTRAVELAQVTDASRVRGGLLNKLLGRKQEK